MTKLSRIFSGNKAFSHFKTLLVWVTAFVWLFNGIYSKLLDMMPRHRMIVARILGETDSWFVISLIGVIEIIIAIWILSRFLPLACASVQTAALAFMNTFELIYAPDLLLLGYAHAGLTILFLGLVWYLAITSYRNRLHAKGNGAVIGRWKILSAAYKQYSAYRKFIRLPEESRDLSPAPGRFVEEILSLGPTFIKLGQILSTRPDILPAHYIKSLERLQENVTPFSATEVRRIIETELGKPVDSIFNTFEDRPAASASLSQVHFATLYDGNEAAVKVQRPGIRERMQAELNTIGTLLSIARLLNKKMFVNLNLRGAFEEFRRYTLQELDFSIEGKTYDRFRENFPEGGKVIFPKIYWDFSTSRVLTMQRVAGLRLREVAERVPLEKRKNLSDLVVTTLINMFVRDGFFHADLHPGNIFFGEDNSITLIDVGMYGELTTEQRERFILYWLAIVLKEKERAFSQLLKLTRRMEHSDETAFYKHYIDLLDTFYTSSIREKSLTQTYLEILISGAKFGFMFPPEMLLQAKALTTAEYIGYVLLPDFNFAETAKPIVTRAFSERLSLPNVSRRISASFPEWFLLGEAADPSLLSESSVTDHLWEKSGQEISKKLDAFHSGDFNEVRHGEYTVEIDKDLESVFNFVTRWAKYPLWHPVYTEDSHIIHVNGEYVFITPEGIGSVFRLDEIVDGYHLLSNAVVTEFERNKRLKWKAPFSMLPIIELGTCLEFERLENGKTRLSEYFFFSESPVQHLFVNRKWFTAVALTNHIREELTGVKNIIEAGDYSPHDMEYLWDGVTKPVRFLGDSAHAIDHRDGGPIATSHKKS